MRSMELVGRERMEVAVCIFRFPDSSTVPVNLLSSNNCQSGVKLAMMMFPTSPTNLAS